MDIHYLQHVSHEGLGSTAEWARAHGHSTRATRFFDAESPPEDLNFDWLFVMGGPMNIYEEKEYPWLAQEKIFIRHAIDAGKTVIGICLGAQLISDVLGAPTRSNGEPEIGWFPLWRMGEPSATLNVLLSEPVLPAFHWHRDRFQPPQDAVPFARSAGCPHQGYVWQGRVFAFQFHPEITPAVAEAFIRADVPLPEGRFVQNAEDMLAERAQFAAQRQRWLAFLSALALTRPAG